MDLFQSLACCPVPFTVEPSADIKGDLFALYAALGGDLGAGYRNVEEGDLDLVDFISKRVPN